MVGYWFWGFLNHSVPLMILGVTLIAISQPFIVNIPTKLSACSFPKKDRVISTMIGVISGSMGCLLGYFLPMIFVPAQPWKEEDNSKSDQDAKMNIQQQVSQLVLFQSIMQTLFLIFVLFLFKGNKNVGRNTHSIATTYSGQDVPPINDMRHTQRPRVSLKLSSLLKKKDFLLLMIGGSFPVGYILSFPIIIKHIRNPQDPDSFNRISSGVLFYTISLIGGVCSAVLVHQNRNFKVVAQVFSLLAVLSFMGFHILLNKENLHILREAFLGLNGFFSMGIFTILFEWAIDLTPKIGESVSVGMINATACILVVVQMLSVKFLHNYDLSQNTAIYGTYTCLTLSFIFFSFIKSNSSRSLSSSDTRATT